MVCLSEEVTLKVKPIAEKKHYQKYFRARETILHIFQSHGAVQLVSATLTVGLLHLLTGCTEVSVCSFFHLLKNTFKTSPTKGGPVCSDVSEQRNTSNMHDRTHKIYCVSKLF